MLMVVCRIMPSRKGIAHPYVQLGNLKMDPATRKVFVDTASVNRKTRDGALMSLRQRIANNIQSTIARDGSAIKRDLAYSAQTVRKIHGAIKRAKREAKPKKYIDPARAAILRQQLQMARMKKAAMINQGIPFKTAAEKRLSKPMSDEVKAKLKAMRQMKRGGRPPMTRYNTPDGKNKKGRTFEEQMAYNRQRAQQAKAARSAGVHILREQAKGAAYNRAAGLKSYGQTIAASQDAGHVMNSGFGGQHKFDPRFENIDWSQVDFTGTSRARPPPSISVDVPMSTSTIGVTRPREDSDDEDLDLPSHGAQRVGKKAFNKPYAP